MIFRQYVADCCCCVQLTDAIKTIAILHSVMWVLIVLYSYLLVTTTYDATYGKAASKLEFDYSEYFFMGLMNVFFLVRVVSLWQA
jgi:hypothetical protein